MLSREHALQVIYAAVDEINGQLSEGNRLIKSPDTVLLGDGATLDSLGFVNLLVTIEERLTQAGAPPVSLIEEVSRDNGDEATLRTLGTIADFVASGGRVVYGQA